MRMLSYKKRKKKAAKIHLIIGTRNIKDAKEYKSYEV